MAALQGAEVIYLLTPDRWYPHLDVYAKNEENILDWEGNMIQRADRVKVLLGDIP